MIHTPPAIAKMLGVKTDKIHTWIYRGDLKAHNLAESTTGRPRWKILDEDLQEFLRGRQNVKPATAPTRYRRRKPKQIKQYF